MIEDAIFEVRVDWILIFIDICAVLENKMIKLHCGAPRG